MSSLQQGGNELHNWEGAVTAWRTSMQAAGMPETTIGQRVYHLRRVARELGGSPGSVTAPDLEAWLAAKPWQPSTKRSYRGSLRAFYRHFTRGRIEHSPAHALPVVRVPRPKPRPTPEAVYRASMLTADARARLAIMLGGVCGLRRGEIARARKEDVEPDLVGWCLRVVGKGGHVRLVPLPEEVAREIRTRAPGWLFPSPRGGHLTPHHLGKIVTAALGGGFTTHTLRHRTGTVAYAQTKDLRAVQELLGHAKPETTAIYTEVSGLAIRAAMESAL